MGFGSFLGTLAGQAAARVQEVRKYESEYIHMSDKQLIVEYKALKTKNGTEYGLRRNAIKMILRDRGVID